MSETKTSFQDVFELYDQRGGAQSGECDFGVHWFTTDDGMGNHRRGPFFRVSVVHGTGDIYAVNQWTQTVELLSSLPANVSSCKPLSHGADCAYTLAERIFAGWAEGGSKPLQWARDRLAGMWRNAAAIVEELDDGR